MLRKHGLCLATEMAEENKEQKCSFIVEPIDMQESNGSPSSRTIAVIALVSQGIKLNSINSHTSTSLCAEGQIAAVGGGACWYLHIMLGINMLKASSKLPCNTKAKQMLCLRFGEASPPVGFAPAYVTPAHHLQSASRFRTPAGEGLGVVCSLKAQLEFGNIDSSRD